MNREIKFKFLDKIEKVMIDWSTVRQSAFNTDDCQVFYNMFNNPNIIPLQYTGIKDKNGKEIFEGNMIKSVALLNDHNQKGATEILIVKYWMGNFCLCHKNNESGIPIYPFNVTHTIEIIGNEFENPELLEK